RFFKLLLLLLQKFSELSKFGRHRGFPFANCSNGFLYRYPLDQISISGLLSGFHHLSNMIKALEWFFVISLVLAIWASKLVGVLNFRNSLINNLFDFLPMILLGIFALFSICVIIFRTLTFNDCPEASAELVRQIQDAKADLKKKGYSF
ncbi:hypothetical protein CSKR_203323, partial [Clonorchis sinensis]